MERAFFSIIIYTKQTNEIYLRDLMESLASQTYDNWELYVVDEGGQTTVKRVTEELFPEDHRVHYRPLRTRKGQAYGYNIGFHFALVDHVKQSRVGYLLCIGQHDRISPRYLENLAEQSGSDLLYTDHDELIGIDRMHPHFKCGINKELLLNGNYIGESFAITYEAARKLGEFFEKLSIAYVYEYLVRAMDAGMSFTRVPGLLYHKRVIAEELSRKEKIKLEQAAQKEALLVVESSLKRRGVAAEVIQRKNRLGWRIEYDGKDYRLHSREYMLLREPDVRSVSRHNIVRMYGLLKQPDIAVVGARFLKTGFTIDNCGYLFDDTGMIYPAFYDAKAYGENYEGLATLPRDVSMVDGAFCMIDAKIYRKLGGFDPKLSGRDVMLDFCLRAKKAGFRTVIDPYITVKRAEKNKESSQESHEAMMEKWGETIRQGDPYYNPNMPMGLHNFSLE